MNYRNLSIEETKKIYTEHMKTDFPPAELKKFNAIRFAMENGWYRAFGAYEEEKIKGYALIAECGEGIGFLDYYAIIKEYRGTGVGSEFFKHLGELSGEDVIILEVESIESSKNAEEETIRKRRIDFYKRSGCVDTGIMYNVFGVEYNILINKAVELNEEFLSKLLSAYEYAYAAILRRDDKDYIYRVK